MSSITTSERLLEMARVGVSHRIRPLCPDAVSVATELFQIEEDLARGERALVVFQASFAALDPVSVRAEDRKVYEKELERRKKRLVKLAKRRDEILPEYAGEIIEAGVTHHALEGFGDLLAVRL